MTFAFSPLMIPASELSAPDNHAGSVPPNGPISALNQVWEAIQWGALGNYARASTLLRTMGHTVPTGHPLTALVPSIYASHLRQQGFHGHALRYDSAALKTALGPVNNRYRPLLTIAYIDAMTGLAADSLGLGHCDQAHRYLERVDSCLAQTGYAQKLGLAELSKQDVLRLNLRSSWVKTELALVEGAAEAAIFARAALDYARELAVRRHLLKTYLIAHVAGAVGVDMPLERVYHHCLDLGYKPLAWACSLVVADGKAESIRAGFLVEPRLD